MAESTESTRGALLTELGEKWGPVYRRNIGSAGYTSATLATMARSGFSYDAWTQAMDRHRQEMELCLTAATEAIRKSPHLTSPDAAREQAEQDAARIATAVAEEEAARTVE